MNRLFLRVTTGLWWEIMELGQSLRPASAQEQCPSVFTWHHWLALSPFSWRESCSNTELFLESKLGGEIKARTVDLSVAPLTCPVSVSKALLQLSPQWEEIYCWFVLFAVFRSRGVKYRFCMELKAYKDFCSWGKGKTFALAVRSYPGGAFGKMSLSFSWTISGVSCWAPISDTCMIPHVGHFGSKGQDRRISWSIPHNSLAAVVYL